MTSLDWGQKEPFQALEPYSYTTERVFHKENVRHGIGFHRKREDCSEKWSLDELNKNA
jgi:hypothetical protein